MMYIDITKIPAANAKWIAKAQTFLDDMTNAIDIPTRNAVMEKNHRYWKLLKNGLKAASYNKCWYSETRNPFSHYHVDHFRPKKNVIEFDETERDGYWWLTFDFTNYRLCGSVGNSKKKDHFAVKYNKVTAPGPVTDEVIYFLDPTSKEDVKLLNFDNVGKVIPSAIQDEAKWNYERAEYTIDKLDLNYPDLVEERKMKWQTITALIKKVNELNKNYNDEPTTENKGKLGAKKDEIRKMLAPCEELTATTRACLRSSGQDWAYKILEEQISDEHCN